MLKKIIVALLALSLMTGALGIIGCSNGETKDTKKESKDNKSDDKDDEPKASGGLAIPALFDEIGFEVYKGDIVEGFDYRDEPTSGDVIIETNGTVKEVADHARKQLKKIGATIVEDDDTEESDDRVRISALHAGKDGTAYTLNIKIASGQDTEKIWVGYTFKTVNEE